MGALKASTALRNKLLDTAPFRTIFDLGFIKIYDGPVPATADAGLDGANTLLLTVSVSGVGLTFESAAVGGAITKTLAETWGGTAVATGTASFYRLVTPTDTGGASTTEPRLQGLVNTSGADLNMTTVSLVTSTPYPIDGFSVSLPTL